MQYSVRLPVKIPNPGKLTLFQGKALEALRADFTDAFDKNCTPSPEFHCELIPYYRNRACALGEALFTHKGFNRKDIEKRRLHNRLNYQFFDAPQVFVLSVNKEAYHEGTLIDCGIFAATLMLAIEGIDCGSCPQ
jgi:nitroreductase